MMTSAQVVETSQSQSNNPSQDYTRLDDHTFKLQTPTYDMTPGFKPFMYQSKQSFTIHPPGNPPGIWTFEDWLVQIPSPRGKKAFRMPHQLVLKYLSSKTNLYIFNQTLFTLFRERYAVLTPSDFFWRPFWKSYSLTKAKFYLVNPLNLAKTEKTHRCITIEQEINPVQILHPSKATFKFPPSWAQYTAKCPGYAWGVVV